MLLCLGLPTAYYCYKSVGFQEVKTEYYHISNENGKVLSLKLGRIQKICSTPLQIKGIF